MDLDTLPEVKDVYVTMLPGGDYKETADKSGDLVKKGFNPVPHFPARSINNEDELKDYISRCKDLGVKQILAIGGSRDPVGKFDSSYQILETGLFDGIKIGIAGHPEGSPDISDSELEKAMIDKKPYADYIVTQWLLDSQPIVDFISKQTIPVHVGITGPMKISSLIKFANIVGEDNGICTDFSFCIGVAPNASLASSVSLSTSLIPRLVSLTTGGKAYIHTANSPGTFPIPKSIIIGIR